MQYHIYAGVFFCLVVSFASAKERLSSRESRTRLDKKTVQSSIQFAGLPVFTDEEVAQCGDIRIPEMTVTPTGVLLLAQCRNANSTASSGRRRLDDMSHAKVLTKRSTDMGKTWDEPMTVLTPKRGHSHPQAVYDRVRKQVILQYQHHPSVDPEFNSTMFQRESSEARANPYIEKLETHAPVSALLSPHVGQAYPKTMAKRGAQSETLRAFSAVVTQKPRKICRWGQRARRSRRVVEGFCSSAMRRGPAGM